MYSSSREPKTGTVSFMSTFTNVRWIAGDAPSMANASWVEDTDVSFTNHVIYMTKYTQK